MTRTLLRSAVAVSLLAAWATTTEACHKRKARSAVACVGAPQAHAGYATPGPAGYQHATTGHATPAAYPGGGYAPAAAYGGYPGGGYAPAAAYGGYPGGGYAPMSAPGVYPGGGYPAGAYGGAPAGFGFGRPGYNPGGLGGPASGLGVRPGLGFGGFGPGR